jgi:hypothetical protein
MSRVEICGVLADGEVRRVPQFDLRNAWLGVVFVWGTLHDKYFGKFNFETAYREWETAKEAARRRGVDVEKDPAWRDFDHNGWRKSWTLSVSPQISEVDWCVLLATFDGFILPKAHFAHAARCFRAFHAEFPTGHVGAWADIVEALERDGYIGFCVNATSVNSNPWWVHPSTAEREAMLARHAETQNEAALLDYDGRPYNINIDTQHRTGSKHWFFDPAAYAARTEWKDPNL